MWAKKPALRVAIHTVCVAPRGRVPHVLELVADPVSAVDWFSLKGAFRYSEACGFPTLSLSALARTANVNCVLVFCASSESHILDGFGVRITSL